MTDSVERDGYWVLVAPFWEAVDIYSGPETFLATFQPVPEPNALLLASHWCQSEVCNGGFLQFFSNSTGVLAPEAVAGFRAIGRADLAELLEKAISFFGDEYPRDQDVRCELLDKLDGDRREQWDPFVAADDSFYACLRREDYSVSADRFAREMRPK